METKLLLARGGSLTLSTVALSLSSRLGLSFLYSITKSRPEHHTGQAKRRV